MRLDGEKHHRRSIRLRGHDYRSSGMYFVTIVCKDRALLMDDADLRAAAEEAWRWLADQYRYVRLDAFVVMPNHIHGIIVITRAGGRGGSRTAPTKGLPKPLGRLVGAFKTVSTKRINQKRGTPGCPVWQRNYYEHVVRDEREMEEIRRYIIENPSHWDDDSENPEAVGVVARP